METTTYNNQMKQLELVTKRQDSKDIIVIFRSLKRESTREEKELGRIGSSSSNNDENKSISISKNQRCPGTDWVS